MKVLIKTFGCIQNTADSEKIRAYFWERGDQEVSRINQADLVVINSCVVRQSAENRVYGLIKNIKDQLGGDGKNVKIIVTGCLAGIKRKIDGAEVWPMGKFRASGVLRDKSQAAMVSISYGCNHFCSYCIVPLARSRQTDRSEAEILAEAARVKKDGFKEIILIGQSVNSWGRGQFPKLLEKVTKMKFDKVSFISSNPWDFSDKLIGVIRKYTNIDRKLHIPVQSGDDGILKRMNRGYTANDYLRLIQKIRSQIAGVRISTDILIGFPQEDRQAFNNTLKLCRRAGFVRAYLNKYSPRQGTVSAKLYQDDVPWKEKQRRWRVLEKLVNKKTRSPKVAVGR